MSMSAGKANLVDAHKKLSAAWQRARTEWDDETARRFQAKHLDPLSPALRQALQAMDALSDAQHGARRDCA